MKGTTRRGFLKNVGGNAIALGVIAEQVNQPTTFHYNMSGHTAPGMDIVKVGIIGLGMRGPGAVERLSNISKVKIVALCDKHEDRVASANEILTKAGIPKAKTYSGEHGWKKMIDTEDLDLVYICTPWHLHTPMAVYAMTHGKHAATEVPAATKMEECWQLVETSEKTKKHCMMLENCCYDFFEMLTLNMSRQGLLGELVHVEGAYIHELRWLNFKNKGGYEGLWRLKENATRNGNLYPTHGLGPIAQCLNINRGDQMDYLVSMSTHDFQMKDEVKEVAAADPVFKPYIGSNFRGNMNNTIIKTKKGKSILLQHDVTSTRPYSRIHLISGTKGIAQKWPTPGRIALGESWADEAQMKAYEEQYTPALVKHVGEIAKKIGGHGGMDFIMDYRLIDSLRNGLPLDQDVYDAALWSAVAPLSEKSVAKRSMSVDIPDFTRGRWKTNTPVDLTMKGGGNTEVKS